MKTMGTKNQLVTVGALEQILDQKFISFGKQITADITVRFREELDSKLAASENRIITSFRTELDDRTDILLQAMSDMVEPMQAKDDELETRVTTLERKIG